MSIHDDYNLHDTEDVQGKERSALAPYESQKSEIFPEERIDWNKIRRIQKRMYVSMFCSGMNTTGLAFQAMRYFRGNFDDYDAVTTFLMISGLVVSSYLAIRSDVRFEALIEKQSGLEEKVNKE